MPAIGAQQWPTLMVIYGAGAVAVQLTFALLYAHTYRLRRPLGLDAREVVLTHGGCWRRCSMWRWRLSRSPWRLVARTRRSRDSPIA